MLGNKSPRAAVKTPKGRAKVVDWLKTLENHTVKFAGSNDEMASYNFNWLWMELGVNWADPHQGKPTAGAGAGTAVLTERRHPCNDHNFHRLAAKPARQWSRATGPPAAATPASGLANLYCNINNIRVRRFYSDRRASSINYLARETIQP